MRKLPGRALSLALLPAVLACVACGASKDSMEKRVSSLQEELTSLQNQHDRMADRLQALEIKAAQAQLAPSPAKAARNEEDDRLSHPPLKVVKLGPGSDRSGSESDEPPPVAGDDKDAGPRPVIKEYGKPPPAQKPAAPGWRAVSATLSQDQHQKGP